MAVIVLPRGGSLRVSRRALLSCVIIGCLLPGANAVLFFAERNVPTGLASLLIASVPLWLVVLRLAGRERMPWQVLVGVGLGFVGVAVLAQPSGGARRLGDRALRPLGGDVVDGLVPLARLDDAGRPVRGDVVRDARRRTHDVAVRRSLRCTIFSPSAGSIVGWVYLVTFGSVVGYTAYVWLLANAPLGLVSTYAYVNPVVAITLGVLFRGEHLTWRLLVGAAIVVVAVAAVVRQEPPPATGEPARALVRPEPEVEPEAPAA